MNPVIDPDISKGKSDGIDLLFQWQRFYQKLGRSIGLITLKKLVAFAGIDPSVTLQVCSQRPKITKIGLKKLRHALCLAVL